MRIGFLSTRLAGTDGVSLETAKLAVICRRLGHEVFYCAGELDGDGPPGLLVPEMHFAHPEALWIHDHSFGVVDAPPELATRIAAMAGSLHQAIGQFVEQFEIDVLVPENALTIPMHVPLGVALADFIAETGIPVLNHNHDFYWERERFKVNCIGDILRQAFPPNLPSVQHLVINSLAQDALRARLGIEATLLPNIFDFASAAPAMTPFNRDLRAALGLTDQHLLILQPTRVVPRKGIELAIELVRRLREPVIRARLQDKEAVLVLTHRAGDEGLGYLHELQEQAHGAGVPFLYDADLFAPTAGMIDGQKVYSLWDAYVHADFVTYPSLVEGFGNALIETLYFRLPALVNRYDVYKADISPKGFDLVEIDASGDAENLSAIDDATVDATVQVIMDPVRRRQAVEHNYAVARQHYSYEAVTPTMEALLERAAQTS
ncbi:MAG: glycosyltransferase family 4 protein [Anaerolineae bacterium]|nr:glycosyltransferase family 4 protein [Anaerolineae bacterium]